MADILGDFELCTPDFYENFIFTENDETLSQLLTIDTQQLYKPESEKKPDVQKNRFVKPLPPSAIEAKKKETIPKRTQFANNWAAIVWRDWAEFRNAQSETATEPGYPIPTDVTKFSSMEILDYWLQRFCHEIRRKDGKPYPPETLQQISTGLQRILRNENVHVNFFKSDDPTFTGFRKALDSRMRELTNEGIGIEKKSADPVRPGDEKQFWESGVFSMGTARGLSNCAFYYNGKVFGLRGGTEHIGLQADQFSMGYDEENGRRYVKFTPRIRKNAQGGLKQSKTVKTFMTPIVHYDQPNSDYSVYRIYETYLNLIPRVGPFYRKPLDGMRFGATSISQKDLKGMMRRFFEEAGISTENRNISNHSGRVTLCSTLYNNNFSDKSVISRSKHCSNAVRTYQREDFNLQDSLSNALEPVVPESLKADACRSTKTEPVPTSDMSSGATSDMSAENSTLSEKDSTVTLQLPSNVTRLIVIKNDGKKLVLEI